MACSTNKTAERPRPPRLRTIREVRREMVKVYAGTKSGAIDPQVSGRLVHCLNSIASLDHNVILESRISALETALDAEAARQQEATVRSNGHRISNEVRT